MRALPILALFLLACGEDEAEATEAYPLDPETGLRLSDHPPVPPLPEWPDNPVNEETKALGHALFGDPRLSGSGRTVCGNCHLPTTDFQSATPLDAPDRSLPDIDPPLPRNAPSLLNVVYPPIMRWDGGHFVDVFDVMAFPYAEANMNLTDLPPEDVHGVDVPTAQVRLKERLTVTVPGYVDLFQSAYDVDITTLEPEEVWRYVGKAIAAYLTIAVSKDSAFDRWNAGDDAAMSEAAVRGLTLFRGRARCVSCHSGTFFSDFRFHNISTSPPGEEGARSDEGRALITGEASDGGKFLTPMLRSVGRTSPYFHHGLTTSLKGVIEKKTGAGAIEDPNHDPLVAEPIDLSDDEVKDLVQFLIALDGAPLDLPTLAMMPVLPE